MTENGALLVETWKKFVAALAVPNMPVASRFSVNKQPSLRTKLVELMRSTRPEQEGMAIITEEAIDLWLRVEELEAVAMGERLQDVRNATVV